VVTIRATTAAAVADAVRDACGRGRTLEVVGTGTRRGYGRPVAADDVLDVGGLAGVVDYDPAELVLTTRPGTPIADIAMLAAAHGQHIAFEPPDLAPLWGGAAGSGTLGGALALGLGGPGTSAAITGAAHVPARAGPATTRLRLAGVPVAVKAGIAALGSLLSVFGPPAQIEDADAFWRDIGGVHAFADDADLVWRVSLPPSQAVAFVTALGPDDARWLFDWGGGLVWVMQRADDDIGRVRRALTATGGDGHATLVRAREAVRRAVPPFQPLTPTLAALTARVRARFDPSGTLNPGRIEP